MTAEPSEWQAFGDPQQPSDGGTAALPANASPPGPLASAASHRRASLAVGLTILAALVGVGVFAATITIAAGGQGERAIIASRSQATPGDAASSPSRDAVLGLAGSSDLLVDVEGAVRSPGLHHVPAGSRIGDAIAAAGGFADRADLDSAARTLNLAEPLTDGAKIRVPVLGEMSRSVIDGRQASAAPTSSDQGAHSGLIDLNHADEAALESLPGIGPVTAAKIITARDGGPFASVDDVVSRKALTASVLDKIRSLVTVSP